VSRRVALAVAAGLVAIAAAGCSTDDEERGEPPAGSQRAEAASSDGRAGATRERPAREPLRAARCPAGSPNCRTARGRILYVERVDPDGDGDTHFVLASSASITAPGLSVIDVKRTLRPSPLPRPGDRLSAAGPVYTGSYGQKQIEAIELHVARRP
jgi:hypothetical protein